MYKHVTKNSFLGDPVPSTCFWHTNDFKNAFGIIMKQVKRKFILNSSKAFKPHTRYINLFCKIKTSLLLQKIPTN